MNSMAPSPYSAVALIQGAVPRTTDKKRVRFSLDASSAVTTTTDTTSCSFDSFPPVQVNQLGPLLPHFSEFTPEHRRELWWTETELEYIRRRARLLAKGIRERSNRKTKASSYSNVIRQLHHDCATTGVPTTNAMHMLEQWNMVGHSRRGLESLTVPNFPQGVSRFELTNTGHVLQAQHYFIQRRVVEREEPLRQVSLKYSQASQLFAIAMAQADAKAALDEHQSQPVCAELVEVCGNDLFSKFTGRFTVQEEYTPTTSTTSPQEETAAVSDKFRPPISDWPRTNKKMKRRYQVRNCRHLARHRRVVDNPDENLKLPKFLWAY